MSPPIPPDPPLSVLLARVLAHRDERDWAQFHTPKELAISLCVESAELLALMQWKMGEDLSAALAKNREAVRDELADVLHSLLLLSSDLQIDLAAALEAKLVKDTVKYPIHKSKGKANKYTEL
jgi:dCTP diphosphatase